ncbi:hypothetical protein J1N10_10345 [Carboxylicivirga sp. A043]|uniref:hypothetical protein n=1 Tax=Carboxylicivirga litoralis TaxID=2816963 RepID=UPI0021CB1AF9|nr:hypothetical protein [Carboxylicivirga sp. A043]MCU4156380.1 hypothetical protein [Carboxylicivirga sp. A043]
MEGVFIHMTENAFKPEKHTINGIDNKSFGVFLLHAYFYTVNNTRTTKERN